MNMAQSFKLAVKSLATSKMRSLLTMLGIIIGVAAVIIIISLGDGMQAMINAEFEKMGTNTIQVYNMGRGGSSRFATEADMREIYDNNTQYFSGYSPIVEVQGTVKYGTETYSSNIQGVSEIFLRVKPLTLMQGRFLQYLDVQRMQPVCVIGTYQANKMFNGDALGKIFTINGNQFEIIGVLEEVGDSTERSSDNIIYIPYTSALRLNGTSTIWQYNYSLIDTNKSQVARSRVESQLLRIYADEDAYFVVSMAELMDTMANMQGTIMAVLVAIAGISLLVGGIGIMNIMLVSVTERTREIGIRKSLGAKGRDIRSQFIIEAATTSLLGGIIGIILGTTLAGIVGSLINITAIPSAEAILTASGVSLAVGMVFGYLPANNAAKLHPIDALRYD